MLKKFDTKYWPGLNESPELIAQEYRCVCWSCLTSACLNESPELIAQESLTQSGGRDGGEASMKVLSLLLRNMSTDEDSPLLFRPQ